MTDQVLTIENDERVHDQLREARDSGSTAIDALSGAVVVLGYDDVERLSHDVRLAGVGLSFFDLMGVPDGALRTWYSSLDVHQRR